MSSVEREIHRVQVEPGGRVLESGSYHTGSVDRSARVQQSARRLQEPALSSEEQGAGTGLEERRRYWDNFMAYLGEMLRMWNTVIIEYTGIENLYRISAWR